MRQGSDSCLAESLPYSEANARPITGESVLAQRVAKTRVETKYREKLMTLVRDLASASPQAQAPGANGPQGDVRAEVVEDADDETECERAAEWESRVRN